MEASGVSRLNAVIHERARLGIMSVLAARSVLTFAELKALLDLTDGNLSVHLRILEESGYVGIEKKFVVRKPQTTVKISKKGRLAFEHYVEVLEEIVKRK
ncbi:MAG: transcriptional regulator [Planctomycetaceae bacterium]|nr:transcriptional regulator [Planctomycetaceae bacterium]